MKTKRTDSTKGEMMETAKVDIEKLQLLNDRISQTIEALNQVRMSVHGLQARTTAQVPGAQFGGYGLSHSGMGPQIPGLATPWAQHQSPWFQQAYPQSIGSLGSGYGLSHSGFDPYRQSVDPFAYARLVQTFPFLVTENAYMRQFY
jgi:hypothetical protein